MKKLLSVLVAVMMLFAFTSVAFAAVTDIAGHWAAADIQALIDKGIVSGDDTGKFNPEGKVTREQYAKMVVLAKGLAVENPATATFSDVPKTAWSFGYVEAAAKAGLIKGFDGKFNPAANITRQDVAVIVARALNLDTTAAPTFADAASIAGYAQGSVAAAAKAGIIKGYADNTFKPYSNASRAEASVMTLRQTAYVAPVVTNKLTKIVYDDADAPTEIETVTIDGKRYDVSNDAQYFVGTQKADFLVLREDTVVAYEKLSSDKVYKFTVSAPDYASVTGKVTATGKDATAEYVIIDGAKVYLAKDEDREMRAVDGDDIVEDTNDISMDKTYLIVKNAAGKGYYTLDLNAKDQEGKVTATGKDNTGYFLVIGGKTFYMVKDPDKATNFQPDLTAMDTTEFNKLVNKLVVITLDTDGKVKLVTSKDADKAGIMTRKPIYVANADDSEYTVTLEVSLIDSDDNYTATKIYVQDEDTLDAEDVTVEEVYHVSAADFATFSAGKTVYVTDSAAITVNGTSKNLQDLTIGAYVEIDLNSDATQKVVKVAATAKTLNGIVESFTENSDDELISVKIAGKEYKYVGAPIANTSNSAATVKILGNNTTLKNDYLVTARRNANDEIVAFSRVADADDLFDATISAVAGSQSEMTNTSENATGKIFVPDNTIEVRYWNGGTYKYAWVKLGFDDDGTADGGIGDNDDKADSFEIYTAVAKAGAGQGWADLVKDDKVAIIAAGNLANASFNGGAADDTNDIDLVDADWKAGVTALLVIEK